MTLHPVALLQRGPASWVALVGDLLLETGHQRGDAVRETLERVLFQHVTDFTGQLGSGETMADDFHVFGKSLIAVCVVEVVVAIHQVAHGLVRDDR